MGENIKEIKCNNNLYNNYYFDIDHQFASNTEIEGEESVKDKLLKLSRKFSIDLSPNLFYARGKLIELLISSDVARYCEFRMVTQILTRRENGTIEKVPTSRAEVFKSSQLSVVEKRFMMQFVQACMRDNDFKDLIDKDSSSTMSFKEFIKTKKLPASISDYLINAVSMSPNDNDTALKV